MDKSMNANGRLIFTNGGKSIKEVNFSKGWPEENLLYDGNKVGTSITGLTLAGETKLIFSECDGELGCFIKAYGFESRELVNVRSGDLPTYVGKHKKILFYDVLSDGSSWLFVSPIESVYSSHKIAMAPAPLKLSNGIDRSIKTQPVQISDDEVVFVVGEGDVAKYNLETSELESAILTGYIPLAWLGDRNELICTDLEKEELVTFNIVTGDMNKLDGLGRAYGVSVIPGGESIIYGRTESKFIFFEKYNAYLYDLLSGAEVRILENEHVAESLFMRNE
ncbi:hypothetical protein OOT55_02095 [Marinimicrobium sp. C6131]|uniref:hypothetical protein n=1 Tax=Marinimicrobium sp. C6131 TaxID=3022676 RepID=UPI00223D1509|nr:hypothetical protein [Marinimicrobium sp. C6131]UZJ44866.1 hypothetical protein OOT55_02095 [Marinimicrobium sp. C6131]